MTTVDVVGVRKRLWIRENASGNALWTDIDSTVRAVGKMVVWVEDDAEDNTISSKR